MAESPDGKPPDSAGVTRHRSDAHDPAPQAGSQQRSTCNVRELTGADRPVLVRPGEHPLVPAVRWAKATLAKVQRLNDYSATLIARQRVNGKLEKPQAYYVKIRHQPFSVYTRGMGPASIKGEEAIYVEGRNDGKIWAHAAGLLGNVMPALSLDPTDPLAMRGMRRSHNRDWHRKHAETHDRDRRAGIPAR